MAAITPSASPADRRIGLKLLRRGVAMHQRSPKETAIDVILYERDLLRHCAKTVDSKRTRSEESPSHENRAEYYLAIEGFLLHFRNLLGFFINKRMNSTDLTIDHSQQWADGRQVDETLCQKLTERAQKVNQEHGLSRDVDCYKKISWFLQHCIDHRYRLQRSWDIAGMFADFSPILNEFVGSVAPAMAGVEVVTVLGKRDYGTATITKVGPPLSIENLQCGVGPLIVPPKK